MSEYYAVQRSGANELEHYGIKGMKWHVRKAIAKGSDRALGRQYKKAAKKLAKLEKRGANGKKYAKRAARYGAGAAVAGGLAALGTRGVSAAMKGAGGAMANVGRAAGNLALRIPGKGKVKSAAIAASQGIRKAGVAVQGASSPVANWGKSKSIGDTVRQAGRQAYNANPAISRRINTGVQKVTGQSVGSHIHNLGNISNSGYARLGAAAVGAGLGVAAGRNAYKAATAKRNREKAAQFKAEMNKAFAGTKYANGAPRQGKKRRGSRKG